MDTDVSLTLLHNPRCSKSRAARALLEDRGVAFRERRYLDDPLTRPELESLAKQIGRPVREWVRRGESVWVDAGLSPTSGDDELLDAIATHPILLERPIAIRGDRAVVGRPTENVLELCD